MSARSHISLSTWAAALSLAEISIGGNMETFAQNSHLPDTTSLTRLTVQKRHKISAR
jgi:hypothetical protein